MNTNKWKLARRLLLVPGCAMLGVSTVVAQATTQVDAATLAKYDLNNNGVLDASELTTLQADQAQAGQTPVTTAASGTGEQSIIELSPFQVDASGDIGYYAENTLAGSRLNTNVGDLAASITVVTKQQLDDTGAIDINDVFMYEANTEGANTYTPATLNRGVIRDSIGGYSTDEGELQGAATANRVRGLGAVDTAQNNHPTIARLAFDSYNTNTIEINRGPNSMLFGTGSAAGIVNQSTSEAVIGQQRTSVSGRVGSYGAWRASISTNIPLGDKLALYVAGLYDERGYPRKPSYDIYRRQYAALTYQPFRTTKITASFENYDNRNSRPNFASPGDYVTPWLEAGRPGWNPSTQMITIMDTGQTIAGAYVESTLDPRWTGPNTTVYPVGNAALTNTESLRHVGGISFGTRNQLFIDQEQIVGFWVGQLTAGGTTANGLPANAARTPAQWIIASSRLTQSTGFTAPAPPPETGATHYGNWYQRSITDKSIYDWDKYNVQGANHGSQSAKSYNVELQQQILPNLNLSVGWFRQEMDEIGSYGLGQANNSVRVYIDTNTHNLDGTVNPYFGTPFVSDWQADTFVRPEINDSRRAMLAYGLDFTANDGWTRHLGTHRFLALGSTQHRLSDNLRYRLSFNGGDPRFLPANASNANAFWTWSGNAAAIERKYYMGQNANGIVERGATTVGEHGFSGGPGKATLGFYDWTNQRFGLAEMPFQPNLFYAGGNYGRSVRNIDATSLAWQGYLWDSRIIPTMGWRKDELTIRQYNGALTTNAEKYTYGFGNLGPHAVLGDPYNVEGSTTTKGVVVRPFRGWGNLDRRAENGSFVADFVRGLSFHYNESDNFNAPSNVRVDFFGNLLEKPSGEGKDWGIGGSVFNNKLSFKLNFYESSNKFATTAAAGTALGRTVRIDDGIFAWARQVVRVRNGQNPADEFFDNNQIYPLTPAQIAEVSALWGLPWDGETRWPSNDQNATITGTESNLSKGTELQLIYNPVRNWNIKLTFGKQEAFYSDAVGELQRWIDHRKPQWEALTSGLGTVYTKFNGNLLDLSSAWAGYGFSNDANSNATGGTGSMRGTYNSIVEPQLFQLTALQGASAPNLRKYSGSIITNYSFQQGRLNGFAVGGSVRWADKAVAGYYGELDPTRYARPLADPNARAEIVFPDIDRPIYTPAETHVDVWASYTRRILNDRVRMKLQLNVRDAMESSKLQAVLFQPDGSPAQYRIRDGRTWMLTSTFDF